MFDNVVSADFTHKYKTILFVIKLFFMNLPILLALVINNYIDVNVNIKMYKSDKIKMYNYSKLT